MAPGLPLAFLVDYDGTIADTQLTDELLLEHAESDAWRAMDEAYLAGTAGSRDQLVAFVAMLEMDEAAALATVAGQPHDASFRPFVELARSVGAHVEVVSDGYGFYVAPGLASIGVTGVPIATARTTWESGRATISFPFGHPACFVCGTCKRERALHHAALGRHVVMVGDGPSDRYAAAHADTIFAKSLLADLCDRLDWPYRRWSTFDDVSAWLRDVASHPERVAPPVRRPFVCGPEAWGPGRHDPPPD
jgi:2-hydroxy-3-keto-5-methylthiopentenyl-1-phosphate phosphatase